MSNENVKSIRFFSFTINLSNKYGKQLLDTAIKTELDALKTASKKVVFKIAETADDFIGNKIADKIVKPKSLPAESSKNIKEIVILLERREKNIEWIKTRII